MTPRAGEPWASRSCRRQQQNRQRQCNRYSEAPAKVGHQGGMIVRLVMAEKLLVHVTRRLPLRLSTGVIGSFARCPRVRPGSILRCETRLRRSCTTVNPQALVRISGSAVGGCQETVERSHGPAGWLIQWMSACSLPGIAFGQLLRWSSDHRMSTYRFLKHTTSLQDWQRKIFIRVASLRQ